MPYGYRPEEEEEDPANYVEMPAEEDDAFEGFDALPERFPAEAPPEPVPSGRPGSSFDRSGALARAHDRDNTASITGELVNNITNAFTRKPSQGKDRTELFARQRAEMASEEGQARKRAESDPASDASRQYRELVRQAMPEVADQMGKQFERLTPAYGATALPFMKEAWARKSRAAQLEANARAAAAKEAKEEERRAEDQRLSLEKEQRGYTHGERVAGIASGRRMDEHATNRAADIAAREAEDRRKAGVRGLDFAPGAVPSIKKAEKMEEALVAAKRMKAITQKLRELHSGADGVGTEMTGPISAQMDQLYAQMITEGKNIAALGALSGPDMGLITRIVGESPTSLRANFKAIFGTDNTAAAIDGVDRWVDTSESAARDVFGYQLPGGGGGRDPAAKAAREAEKARLRIIAAGGSAQ
jgi:hypothetical protein